MPRKTLGERNTRKLLKIGNGSIALTLPIEMVRNLKWREKQKVTVRQEGNKLIIEDWKK
jgi:antitoxin component of MazEF toxin-antitoxin module